MVSDRLGVSAIGGYLPTNKQDNIALAKTFMFADDFIATKIGVTAPRRKDDDEETSDLCVKAFADLQARCALDAASLDLIVVVTQNPDGRGLPHTSAVVHKKLNLPKGCFAFDVSLGCSGYVAALAIVTGFLEATRGKRAVLFTADPYSKVIDPADRNTTLLFGDAATATLIEPTDRWQLGRYDVGTDGQKCSALEVRADGKLFMDGRGVFDFCALNVPGSVARTLSANGVTKEMVDRFVLHPGSKYIVDVLARRLALPAMEFPAAYGNTISSSIPLQLKELDPTVERTVLISGFGVGLSWATGLLKTAPEASA
jgi:3-oxoacyl-[acyl-carrier-protein] synthase III